MTIHEIRGASDERILERIRELTGSDDWSDAQELALLKAEARRRGLEPCGD